MLSFRRLCLLLAVCFNASLAQESITIDDGYKIFAIVPGRRYKVYTNKVTWNDAVETCLKDGEGSHLVVLNSRKEAKVIEHLHKLISNSYYFFAGINDIALEGYWMTTQGDLVADSGYNVWENGQPDDHNGDENCGAIGWQGLYNDLPCSSLHPFVCEKPNA